MLSSLSERLRNAESSPSPLLPASSDEAAVPVAATEPFTPPDLRQSRASKEWRNPASRIARNARFAFYVALTVNGGSSRRARADRVATVLRDLEEQPRLQR
jgi:hypothetical protein